MDAETTLYIDVPGAGRVSAALHGAGGTLVILGHGAGSQRRTPGLVRFAEALAASGRRVLLYNFPYSEAGRRIPDRTPVLEATTRAVGAFGRERLAAQRLVHGGRSMGGRMASQIVAGGAAADGLLLLGYPLHPPGQPDKLRDAHLERLTLPTLFVQGTRDAFARWDLLTAVLGRLGPQVRLHAVADADHGFAVPRRCGRTAAQVEDEIVRVCADWLSAHGL
jgi:hypothetical protein